MKNKVSIRDFDWDIAFSLCKQDVEFGKKLVNALNPSLRVFFYEYNQEELISKSGPEEFASIFKEKSRIVIILSRKEWSETYYTDIERNAIIDRTAVKNEGYQFLLIIPMKKGEVPAWYPSTRIYVDPLRFGFIEIARFIEFKVIEEGGKIKSLTLEDRYNHLLERIEEKKSIILLQQDQQAIEFAKNELILLRDSFNKKCQFLKTNTIGSTHSREFTAHDRKAQFGIDEFLIELEINTPNENVHRMVTTQDVLIIMRIYKGKQVSVIQEEEKWFYYYSQELKGWSKPQQRTEISNKEMQVLFRNNNNTKFYDLTKPQTTDSLIDEWFQKLFNLTTTTIEEYL